VSENAGNVEGRAVVQGVDDKPGWCRGKAQYEVDLWNIEPGDVLRRGKEALLPAHVALSDSGVGEALVVTRHGSLITNGVCAAVSVQLLKRRRRNYCGCPVCLGRRR
jgi:hypothetical protein